MEVSTRLPRMSTYAGIARLTANTRVAELPDTVFDAIGHFASSAGVKEGQPPRALSF
jgi:hypothetical protein